MRLKAKRSQLFVNSIREGSNENLNRKWDYDRRKFLNASDSGLCLRRLWYRQNNIGFDGFPNPNGYMKRGTMTERYVKESLLNTAKKGPLFFDDLFFGLRRESESVSGNPDFVCRTSFDSIVIGEIKSIASEGWDKVAISGPRPEHQAQVETNMALYKKVGTPQKVGFCNGPPDIVEGMILYVDASDYDRIVEFSLEEMTKETADQILKDLNRRFEVIQSVDSATEVPAEGKNRDNDYKCDFCENSDRCPDPKGKGLEVSTIAMPEGKEGLIEDYATMANEAASFDEPLKELRSEILGLFPPQRDSCSITDCGYTAKRSVRRRSGALDKVKLAEDGIELEEYQKPPIEYVTLTVTKNKGECNEH